MHGDGGRGVHVRVSCWLSAADGASESCDIGAVGASASLVWCDERADGIADGSAYRCADGLSHSFSECLSHALSQRIPDACAHCVSYSGTHSAAESCS